MTSFSANETIHDVQRLIHRGGYPEEWGDTPNAINDHEDAPSWAKDIISDAKVQLALYLLPKEMQLTMLADETIEKIELNCNQFSMKEYNYPLTRSMFEAGYRQYQSVVDTKTIEQAKEEGVKHSRYRYACHFWVAPTQEILLGKVKLDEKHVPSEHPEVDALRARIKKAFAWDAADVGLFTELLEDADKLLASLTSQRPDLEA